MLADILILRPSGELKFHTFGMNLSRRLLSLPLLDVIFKLRCYFSSILKHDTNERGVRKSSDNVL